MGRDDLIRLARPPTSPEGDPVAMFLALPREAQWVCLDVLRAGADRSWRRALLAQLEEDDRTGEALAGLSHLPPARA